METKGESNTAVGSATPEQRAEQCSKEIQAILEKYDCAIVLRDTFFFGQKVLEPIISAKQ